MVDEDAPEPGKTQIVFDYRRATDHRAIHVSGAFGMLTPQGEVAMGLFTELPPLPRQTTQTVDASGVTGPEDGSKRVIENAYPVREIQVTGILSRSSARSLANWLTAKADELDQVISQHAKAKAEREAK